jgi:(2Fe-2S) ferredoxin
MSFYQHHVFFCTNQRDNGGQSCSDCNAAEVREYTKQKCKDLGIHGPGKIRINSAGCLDRCAEGPVMVIYPDETWYTYVDKQDIDEIIEKHLIRGKVVERLRLK